MSEPTQGQPTDVPEHIPAVIEGRTTLVAVRCAGDRVTVLGLVLQPWQLATAELIDAEIRKHATANPNTDNDALPGVPVIPYNGWEYQPVLDDEGGYVWRFIDVDDLPGGDHYEDDAYRNAIAYAHTGPLGHDINRAREVHRQRVLRPERYDRLQALDHQQLRALALSDAEALRAAERAKDRLRDVTAHPAIEAAQSVDELRQLTLDALTSS